MSEGRRGRVKGKEKRVTAKEGKDEDDDVGGREERG